jgi:hypothetical protein
VGVVLLQWFNQKQAERTLACGPICAQKVKFYYEALGLEGEFNACIGWLTRFKQWYGIYEIAVRGVYH